MRRLWAYAVAAMTTYTTTYDQSEAEAALVAVNDRRQRLGFTPTSMRGFQKSLADGKGRRYQITLQDGQPVDVSYEFDAHF